MALATPVTVSIHGYDSPYLVKAFIDDADGSPICGLWDASLAPQVAEALNERAALRKALEALYEWYDRDGSVGGANEAFEENRHILAGSLDSAHPPV